MIVKDNGTLKSRLPDDIDHARTGGHGGISGEGMHVPLIAPAAGTRCP